MLCLCRRIQRRWDNNEIVGEYRLETLSLWKSESNHEITDWYFCMRDNWHGFLYKVCPEPSSVDTLSVNQTSDSSTKIQHDAVKGRKKESQKKKDLFISMTACVIRSRALSSLSHGFNMKHETEIGPRRRRDSEAPPFIPGRQDRSLGL